MAMSGAVIAINELRLRALPQFAEFFAKLGSDI
jgi:hypothetical protein